MQSDHLLDSHALRLANDSGYQAIWHLVQSVPAPLRLLMAMTTWADNLQTLRHVIEHLQSDDR